MVDPFGGCRTGIGIWFRGDLSHTEGDAVCAGGLWDIDDPDDLFGVARQLLSKRASLLAALFVGCFFRRMRFFLAGFEDVYAGVVFGDVVGWVFDVRGCGTPGSRRRGLAMGCGGRGGRRGFSIVTLLLLVLGADLFFDAAAGALKNFAAAAPGVWADCEWAGGVLWNV